MVLPMICAVLFATFALGRVRPALTPISQTAVPAPVQAAPSAADPLAEELAALGREFQAAREKFNQAYQAAATEEEREKHYFENFPAISFWPRYEALAQRAGTSDVAVDAWLKVIEMYASLPKKDSTSEQTPADRALTQLMGVHLESAKLGRLPSLLAYSNGALRQWNSEAVFETLLAKSPHAAVQGMAAYQFAAILSRKSAAADKDARRARAIALYERVAKDYGDLPLREAKTLGQAANAALFELRNLQIGMSVPDFEATDQDGVKFKLSDYRGKVVVLDFWGFW